MAKRLNRTGRSILGSLAFKIPLLFIIMLSFMMGAFLWVMENYGKPMLLSVAKEQVRQSGESIVAILGERLALTSSLVTSMANAAEVLPADDRLHKKVIKRLLAYQGTEHFIAGGGVWPEPYQYQKNVQRRSFFWGRDQNNQLEYFDDYNFKEGNGYHHEEWYVPARFLTLDSIYWSRSYMDPYSYQSMVTATAPMYRDGLFYGVATVDLKLEGLSELLDHEAKKFQGYAYALDRNGTFLSFPNDEISKRSSLDEHNNEVVEYLNINEVSKSNPNIPNIIESLSGLENISKLKNRLIERSQSIAKESYQIELEEAHRIISIIADPFKNKPLGESFIKEYEEESDPILNTEVLINVFHVPATYWKIITVTPKSVVTASSDSIKKAVLSSFIYVIILGLFIGFIYIYWVLIKPLRSMSAQLNVDSDDLGMIKGINGGELGALANKYNRHSQQLIEANKGLEQSVAHAEQATQAKAHFLANMSHEIRTPMNGILGMLDILLRDNMSEDQQHYAQLAKTSADNLLLLINDILDFSKIEAGKLDLEILEFDLRSFLSEFAITMAHLVQNKGLELILDVNDIEQGSVKGDPGRLRQVLTNLVSNAIKFTHAGEVLLKVNVQDTQDDKLQVNVSVTDTGIGIDKDKQQKLFDSFSQVDASTTRQFGGTGLGLAICKQLCELMGGGIDVSSQLGKGSCFSFHVVFQKCERTLLNVAKLNLNNNHIMLVDDNHNNRLVLTQLLKSWGAEVTATRSGQDALGILKSHKGVFDALILDMQMPEMNGEQLGRHIRKESKWDNVPLIMMASRSERGEAKYLASIGFAAYLPKPATPQDIHDALIITIKGGTVLEQATPLVTHHHLTTLRGVGAIDEQKTQKKSARLLLVEDNFINQEVAISLLNDIGYHADVAENGKIALEMLAESGNEKPYDVVLMDCQMPVMDGYEATVQIRRTPINIFNPNIPIIAVTANAMQGDKEKCLGVGMDDYLAKPINMKSLQEMLHKWLES